MSGTRPTRPVAHLRLEPRDTAGHERRAERAAFGYGDDVDRQPRAVGQRPYPGTDAGTAAGGHDASRRDEIAGEVELMAHHEPRGFVGGAGHMAGRVREIEPVQRGTQIV